ncbi:MAG: hypothetical protein J6W52_07760 [Bacteroidaceae bacterium]|nr:hypothetical protein [Bacteroidaceae bacterium]
MNNRKILFFLFIVIEMLVALLLEFLTDSRGPLMDGIGDAQFQYVFGIVCAFSAIISAFLAIKKKQLHPIIRMATVMSGVNMILFDYYFFYDTNLLYFLPVLAIAYMFIWPATED